MPDTIADTSVIQYLFQTGLLDLLPRLYSSIVVPNAVAQEISNGRSLGVKLPDLERLPWAQLRSPKLTESMKLVTDLGAGERAVLALGLENPGSLLILDDKLARRYASYLKLRLTGTLGVLLKAKAAGHLLVLKTVLEELDLLSFRVSEDTRKAVLKLAGESD
jgi:predicted nucleic acid-binding protein